MYQLLIKFHPHPAIITQVLCIFEVNNNKEITMKYINFIT